MFSLRDAIRKEISSLNGEMRNKAATYIVAGFGLVAGLAWNDAIKSLIEYIFPRQGNGILAKFAYAILITFAVGFVSVYIVRILKGSGKK